jgi:hypothetical protein
MGGDKSCLPMTVFLPARISCVPKLSADPKQTSGSLGKTGYGPVMVNGMQCSSDGSLLVVCVAFFHSLNFHVRAQMVLAGKLHNFGQPDSLGLDIYR